MFLIMSMNMLMWMSTTGMGVAVDMETGRVAVHCPPMIHSVEVLAGLGKKIPVMGDNA